MVWAVTIQANMILLFSGATLILNFLKKLMPKKMGPATAACKKLEVKILPRNWTIFVMNPQEGIGNPFVPLRRRSDGLYMMHVE